MKTPAKPASKVSNCRPPARSPINGKCSPVTPTWTASKSTAARWAQANDGNELPNTPKNSASLWTTYQVTPKLTIGGGAFYVDDVFGNVANTTMVESYVRYDAMAAYKLTKNIDLQLNVQNLTDETYYDKAFSTHFANQAAGRTALLSTNFHF